MNRKKYSSTLYLSWNTESYLISQENNMSSLHENPQERKDNVCELLAISIYHTSEYCFLCALIGSKLGGD